MVFCERTYKKGNKLKGLYMGNFRLLCEILEPVKEEGSYYTISLFPINRFAKDLSKRYKTSRIFKVIEATGIRFFGRTTIKIHRFFIPEFIYMLESLPPINSYTHTIDLLKERTWYKTTQTSFTSRINTALISNTMNVTLKPHQLDFIKLYDDKKQQYMLDGYILGFEQGLGKTLTSLALMESLKKDCIIIVAPKSTLMSVWKNEIETFYKSKKRIWVVNEDQPQDADVYIFNYESMTKFPSVYNFISKKKRVGLIVDESHNFLHLDSKRTKNLLFIKNKTRTEDLLLMSGTPIKALGSEMIPVLMLLDPMFDSDAQNIFANAFGLNTVFATEILKNRMGMIMHRKLKSEALNLPEKNEVVNKIKIPNGNTYTIDNVKKLIVEFIAKRKEYYEKNMSKYQKDFEQVMDYLKSKLGKNSDFIKYLHIIENLKFNGYDARDKKKVELVRWANIYEKEVLYPILTSDLKRKFLTSKSAVKYVDLKIKGEVLGNLLVKLRAEMTSDMIKHSNIINIINESEKKTVIFTTFVKTVEAANEFISSKGFKPSLAYGKTSSNIKGILVDFKNNPKLNPLIATVQTLSTGVTLVEANTVIFLNKPWRYTDYQQASDRVHRIGQESEVFIYTFLLDTGSSPNLSEKMEDIMQWSKDMFEAIVGDK